ncbi:hypothetical protein CTA2_2168, partial [Colletotrichum tanaceti]
MRLDSRTPPRRYLALISVLLALLSTMVAAQNGTETATTARQCIPRPTTATGAPPSGSTAALPKNFGMIIHRAYEMLDVFGPLEALGVLARIQQLNLYLIAETMDPVT